jgi:hypothetical protein
MYAPPAGLWSGSVATILQKHVEFATIDALLLLIELRKVGSYKRRDYSSNGTPAGSHGQCGSDRGQPLSNFAGG